MTSGRGYRDEPPLTAPRRPLVGPGGRVEPPVLARKQGPAPPETPAPRPFAAESAPVVAGPSQTADRPRPVAPPGGGTVPGPPAFRAGSAVPKSEMLRLFARAEQETPAAATRRVPRDPAPSRLTYRMQRMWLTPVYRALFRVGLPAFLLTFGAGVYLADDNRRAALTDRGTEILRSVQERPEFMVNLMVVKGASPNLDTAVRVALPLDFPVSSFDLDLEAMRLRVAELDAVASADLRIRPGGILEVQVRERVPAVVWRGTEGLALLDAAGHRVMRVASRLERPDLPVIAGDGADRAVAEALQLIEAAAPVAPRLRGLVRMGERRWDLVLDSGQRILLPEEGALAALERVMALALAQDLLARDISVVDMRYEARPTLRLTEQALAERRRLRDIEAGATNG